MQQIPDLAPVRRPAGSLLTAGLVALALGLGAAVTGQSPTPALPEGAPATMAEIRAADLLEHATWLADDERGGRLTGSPGQEAAAQYIADHVARLGLEPLGDVDAAGKRSFFQRYGISRTALSEQCRLAVGELSASSGFAVLGGEAFDIDFTGEFLFAGRGRTRGSSADLGDDVDLTDVIPVVLLPMPRGNPGRELGVEAKFGLAMRPLMQAGATARNLGARGARAVVFVVLEDQIGLADVMNYLAMSVGKDLLVPRFQGGDAGMGGMARMLGGRSGVATMVLTPELGAGLLAEVGVDVAAARAWLAGEAEPVRSDARPKGSLRLLVERDDAATACNVVACLRGSDPRLASEALVYSAHMDHVGRRVDGEVFNGADDNASGSAGLMGIATAFAAAPAPRRSVVFLSVSGEELGLWGSAFFADHPTWPIDDIVANINTDMIGRSGPESGPSEVTVTPSHSHRMFSTIVQDAARFGDELGLRFTDGDKYYQRSDHYNFVKKGIPAVFFCNGEHEDYHQVTDHADKLDARKMERIARLAFWTGWAVAEADERPRTLGPRADWHPVERR